jgi:hypothetical protein
MLLGVLIILGVGISGAGIHHAAAAQKQSGQGEKARDAAREQVDEAIQAIFTAADKNRNHELSRIEFGTAQTALHTTIEQLAARGVIGAPKGKGKGKGKADESATESKVDLAALNKMAKSNHVTQAQFTDYAQTLVAETEQQLQQMRAMSEQQRKAYQELRRARRSSRMQVRTPFSY